MKGKRVQTHSEYWDSGPGSYMPIRVHDKNGVKSGWMLMCPNGHNLHIGGELSGHVVKENEDGTITVQPNPPSDPENSNSIQCLGDNGSECWHGYIYNGDWQSV